MIGKETCPIVDTWWQTETGGILITPLPGAMTLKPGSASRPFFGVEPVVLRDDGTPVRPERGRQAVHQEAVAGHDAHDVGRPRALHRHLLHDVPRHLLHRRRLPHRRGRRLLAHGPHRRRGQRVRPPHRHRGSRKRAGEPSEGGRSGRGAHAARHQGPGPVRLRDAQGRRRAERRAQEGAGQRTCARRSARSPCRTRSSSPRRCPRPARGKIMRRILRKIAENARPKRSATPPRWPTRTWSRIW